MFDPFAWFRLTGGTALGPARADRQGGHECRPKVIVTRHRQSP
jgi:hypothetical protein